MSYAGATAGIVAGNARPDGHMRCHGSCHDATAADALRSEARIRH
jgi:hypothetical protein